MSEAQNVIGATANNSSPKTFMVLDATSRGMAEFCKMAKVTILDKAQAELAINDLAAQRLVFVCPKERGPFEARAVQVSITETGTRLLEKTKNQLEKKAINLRNSYCIDDRNAAQFFMNENRAGLQMIIFAAQMTAVTFSFIMSFGGMAMNDASLP